MHINKIHSVQTIALVARELGEDEDWLADIAAEMEPEDGLIWVYSVEQEDGIMAFTEFGVESLRNFIAIHRDEMK
ncbi:hypothetical protein [Chelativorans alearense]|uniref:hypothetical protein n=1 Tax=Chelativorans alearense TaxID=2681495 RepID=UPI0013D6E9F4|nr:hypothetical protein [Chelativorans alearense]